MKNYGAVIAKLRKKKDLTQEQLGKKLNVTYQAVSKWENNLSEPDLETVEKLTDVFGISLSEFFDMAKNPEDIDKKDSKSNHKTCTNCNKDFIKTKPWILVAILGALIAVLSLCAFLIPVKYSSSKIYQMIDPSVFCITAEGSSTKQAGTGFFINDTGLAVTNYHVIQNCTSGKIQLNDGKTYDVKSVVGCDENKDIAIIQIDIEKSKGVKLANSNKVKVGEVVYAIGYPESFQLGSADSTFTQGIISKTSYSYQGNTYIQTTVDMTKGNSGGVLVNEQGKVIGITTLMMTNGLVDYMNMAIPINKVKNVEREFNASLSDYYKMHKTFCFYSNGAIISKQDFVSGHKIAQIEDPIKIGYTFGGWYTSDSFETPFDFDTPVTDQIACYAKWTPNTYTICFNANGGEGTMTDVVATYDKELTLPNNLYQLEHYKLKGWQQQNKEIIYSNNQIVKNLTSENNGVVTLNALWEMQEYTISFNANNADSGTMENITLKYDQTTNLPENQFSKTGYLFNGWTYNGKTYQEYQEVSKLCETEETIELVAGWKPITYTIRFTFEDQSYEQTFTYDEPKKLLPSSYSKEYYNFLSWYCSTASDHFYNNEEEILNLTETQGQIFTFVAQFSEYTYSIRYNPEQEIDLENCKVVTYKYSERALVKASSFSKTGYKLIHFIDDEGNIYKNTYVVNDGVGTWVGPVYKLSSIDKDIINFYAIWEENTYTAYYKYELKNETRYTKIGTKTYEEEFTLIEPEYIDDGYEFLYWELYYTYLANQTVSKLTGTDKSTIYLLAKYQPKQYTINFEGNGATSGEMLPMSATFDQEITIPENSFVKEGYTFIGWQFNDNFYTTTNIGIPITTYTDSITLTAYWAENLKGEGTIDNPYTISTVDEMQSFADLSKIDTFENKYVVLTNDIDCGFSKLRPISFAGNFNGNGYKLYNVDYSSSALFEINEGTIENLGVDNLKIERVYQDNSNTETVAGLVHTNKGILNRCYVKGSITITNQADIYVGGLIYTNKSYSSNKRTIEYCYTDLVVKIKATTDISNCYVCGFIVNTAGNGLQYNYALANIDVDVQNVENLYVNAFTARTKHQKATFAQANICVSATNSTKYSFAQHVQYYTDDSQVVVTINGQNIADLITETALTTNLQNEEWNENNCFNITGIWTYTEGEFPKPNASTQTIVINSQEEFLQLNNKVLKNDYVLNCDIDLTDISFKILENHGVFDGNGHIISNFSIVYASDDELYGLFIINYNTIKNIGLSNLNISLSIEGDSIIGGIVAENNGVVNACFVKGDINVSHVGGSCYIGGIAGYSYNLISNCHVDADIVGINNNLIVIGGICAGGTSSQINNCYTQGNYKSTITIVSVPCIAYGITASSSDKIKDCFSLANIETTTVSTFTDKCEAGFISKKFTNCYAYSGQVRTISSQNSTRVDYPTSSVRSLSSLCSKTLLESMNFKEFTTQENLTNNPNEVWIISGTELPKLWFEQ